MKTIKTNNIIVLIGLMLIWLNMSAQLPRGKKVMSDELMKSSYIFEGKVISYKHDYKIKVREGEYRSYSSYLVEVKKIVKGNIEKGTINVLLAVVLSSDGNITIPGEGLYFCYEGEPIKDSSVVNTNSKSLEYVCGESMANGELKKDDNDNLINYFPTIAEFYKYISANYGVKIEDK